MAFAVVVVGAFSAGAWLVVRKVEEAAIEREAKEQEAEAREAAQRRSKEEASRPAPPPPSLAPFEEPVNPYKPGTQTRLRELGSIALPAKPVILAVAWGDDPSVHPQLAYSSKHQLLFVRDNAKVWVYDVAAQKPLGAQLATTIFTDMSLAPDQSALFVVDIGEWGGGDDRGMPLKPTRVHRFDLQTRAWADRRATTQAGETARRIEAVDEARFVLLEHEQWVQTALYRWEADGCRVRGLSRGGRGYEGDIEYDPRTGRVYHGSDWSHNHLCVNVIKGDELTCLAETNPDATGSPVVLSRDGSRLYYRGVQLDVARTDRVLRAFPAVIYAASRDIAFGPQEYYAAATGERLGTFGFTTSLTKTFFPDRDKLISHPPAIAVSPDGMSVWVIDRDDNVARQFAIEGEK